MSFENPQYSNPNPRSVDEWIERLNPITGKYYTVAEAEQKIAEEVFGVGFQRGADGKPIEVGKGSAAQPTQQHFEQLVREKERLALMGRHLTPEAIGDAVAKSLPTGNAVTPELIAELVAAAVTAALAAGKPSAPRVKRKYTRRTPPSDDGAEAA